MKNRIFTSYAAEDKELYELLVKQAQSNQCPFEFVTVPAKQPWDKSWITDCRNKIKDCDGMIVIITHNTPSSASQIWEINCAYDKGIPYIGIWGHYRDRLYLPDDIATIRVINWTWDNLDKWIKWL